jgi:glycosyltransferase involved in cell wall biosynthesis
MPMLYAAADAVVCPSLYESFGLVPLEALSSGVPVVVPEGTYWGDRIRSQGGGLVYPREEPERLSGALLDLASSAELRARLSLEGPAVAAPFTWEKCTGSWAELLASVSTSGSPR